MVVVPVQQLGEGGIGRTSCVHHVPGEIREDDEQRRLGSSSWDFGRIRHSHLRHVERLSPVPAPGWDDEVSPALASGSHDSIGAHLVQFKGNPRTPSPSTSRPSGSCRWACRPSAGISGTTTAPPSGSIANASQSRYGGATPPQRGEPWIPRFRCVKRPARRSRPDCSRSSLTPQRRDLLPPKLERSLSLGTLVSVADRAPDGRGSLFSCAR